MSQHSANDMTSLDVELRGEIRGLTVVDDQLFVVSSDDAVVKVYDTHTLKSLHTICIPDMKIPQDLAGCSQNKALYISDGLLKCIYRVNIVDEIQSHWKVRERYKPCGLSVSTQHNLLVTLQSIYRGVNVDRVISKVIEYTSEGQELREIKLDASIKWAWKTIQLSSDQFLICHSSPFIICVINLEGQIIRSCGSKDGRDEVQLNYMHSMAIDKKREKVYVTDKNKDRVEMISSDMTHLGQVQASRQLSQPSCVCIDFSSDGLFVGERSRGRLMISSIELIQQQ